MGTSTPEVKLAYPYAIITCAEIDMMNGYNVNQNIYINSDSQATLHAMTSISQISMSAPNCMTVLNIVEEIQK